MAENAPPGWYQAETDPSGTERYWDGSQWTVETRAAASARPPTTASPGARLTPHGRALAEPWRRIVARLIDGLVTGVISVMIIGTGYLNVSQTDVEISAGRVLLALIVTAAYEVLFTAFRSATPGKMALGIEIVRQGDGVAPIGLATAVQRWAVNLVSLLPAFSAMFSLIIAVASLILIFTDRLRRSVFDFIGKTYVVDRMS